ncbi:hypothetical protein P8452_54750 [Trifolium repens]|nr:hypothetical protein P8452_54750 [Trifolium repens]
MECHRTIGLIVLPVFYDVDPSEVRHQTGEVGKAFQRLLSRISNKKDVSLKWRDALCEAAALTGFVVLNSRNESKDIKDITENIIRFLDKKDLFIADKPVGVDSRVQDVIQLLDIKQSNDVLLLGIWENGINVLVERSLVTIDDENKLVMHDLLRDMGREIICNKPRKEPEERSRLWFHEDVDSVLGGQTGKKDIEGLALKLPRHGAKCYSTKAFEKMKKLGLLQLSGVTLDGDFEYVSRNLRWFSWNGFPMSCIPTNLYLGNLVSIELENNNVKLLWKVPQRMENLKILNLSHSHYLMQTPDFSDMPNLEKLVLKDCPRLYAVSHSIGHLNKILQINLEDCISLTKLPRSIYKLKCLKTLILSGCIRTDTLEEDLEQMESLTTLIADNTLTLQ